MRRVQRLVDDLAAAAIGDTFNFYRDGAGADVRRARLARYLRERAEAPLLLVGEAAGYRGARVSGIPFTAERQLSGRPPAEATATIVQRVLGELGIARDTLLWNVVPTHPHLPGRPLTNRRPTRAEVEASRPFLEELARGRRVVAVGRLAEAATGAPYVRHPSHGGARAFRDALRTILGRDGDGGGDMDEATVREHAEAHGQAIVERDYDRAMGDLTDEVKAYAPEVMRSMPRRVQSAEVVGLEPAGDDVVARIRYTGEEAEAVFVSRWTERDGRPVISELSVGDGA